MHHLRHGQAPAAARAIAPWLPVPRLADRAGPGALVAGIGLLWALAATGAALVHILEYHLGASGSGDRFASIRYMLAHCPLRGGLLVVVLIALVTLLAVWHELRALLGQQRRLALDACRLRLVTPLRPDRHGPRRAARFLALFGPILAGQAGLYALASRLWPMAGLMRMHGAWMYMTAAGAWPLLPLHLAVALALTALVWRLERRFTALRAAIAATRRALARALHALLHVSLPAHPQRTRLSRYCGPAALSRLPPI